jgi:hypothetical protein
MVHLSLKELLLRFLMKLENQTKSAPTRTCNEKVKSRLALIDKKEE